jgi:DNA ligase-1
MGREFLMLAHDFDPKKHGVAGYLISEKLDGMRAFWDGGITRGKIKSEVPWANMARDQREHVCTGLWSRYGNVIYAPDWFLDKMPTMLLDGELFTKRNDRQNLMSIVKNFDPDERWHEVRYFCFDSPPPTVIFSDGHIGKSNKNFNKVFLNVASWFADQPKPADWWQARSETVFKSANYILQQKLCGNDTVLAHVQNTLPYGTDVVEHINIYVKTFSRLEGEGVVVRDPDSVWIPDRSHRMLKVKKYNDDEGVVTGYTTGRLTDKGSKLLGKMGALILQYEGKRMELSGFTEEERRLALTPGAVAPCEPITWAQQHPEEEVPDWIENPNFPRGTRVTFTYRGKSKDSIPQEASYFRIDDAQES